MEGYETYNLKGSYIFKDTSNQTHYIECGMHAIQTAHYKTQCDSFTGVFIIRSLFNETGSNSDNKIQ